MSRANGERGSSAAFVAIMALPLFLLFGLVLDGGRAIDARLTAKNAAAEAARAAASDCDPAILRQQAGRCVVWPDVAYLRAHEYLQANLPGALLLSADPGDVSVSGSQTITRVTVRVRYRVDTAFLGAVGFRQITVEATQSAYTYVSN
ncbi:MAG: pilus assembly protein [Actinobacteria bacterium]|nr:pilus assembly protein [Actinomycetota bacterium]MBI3688031.1 pilus assembly protein [Actinomycetota bacterium]